MTAMCGCCAGVHAETPREVTNRPGLPAVAYRVGTWAEFRASLHAALHSTGRPALAGLRTREDDDVSVALLDGFATLCDVITFYTERLAQESYLRTAVERTSLRELGRLVAYRLRPGVAASTHLAFFVEPPPVPLTPPAPPALPDAANQQAAAAAFPGPGARPAEVTIPAGVPVRSVPGPGEQAQTFETVEPLVARPAWNALRPRRTRAPKLGTQAHLEGAALRLAPGDVLLLTTASDTQFRRLTGVSADAAANRTLVTWHTPLPSSATQWTVAVFRTRAPVFGHAAPRPGWLTSSTSDDTADWPNPVISPTANAVDVDGVHPEICVGDGIALSADLGQGFPEARLYTVDQVYQVSRTDYAVTGRVTRVTLTGGSDYASFKPLFRATTVYAAPEALTLAEEPDGDNIQDGQIDVEGAATGMATGRTLLVAGATVGGGRAVETVRLQSATSLGANRTRLTLDGDLAGVYARDTVVVYGNVAAATHGETAHQILGNGDAARPHQTFDLQAGPLTYVPSTSTQGSASTLAIRVNDVLWHERPSLYGAAPTDRAFVTRDTEGGTVAVQFGDGVRGARLPTGSHNVRAVLRKGIGAAANVAEGALSQLLDPPPGVTKVTNPAPATGGADAQTAAEARASIPLPVRTLGRAVSLLDYADYAAAFVGVAKAHAAVLSLRGGRTIVVTVAAGGGGEVPAEARARLAGSLREHGDPLAAIAVVPHRPAGFRLGLKVTRDPDYPGDAVRAAVAGALTSAFGPDARAFGQPVHRSEVLAVAHTVPGVVAVDLDLFYRTTPPTAPGKTGRLAAAAPAVTPGGTALGAELLALAGFDWLTEEV